MKNKTTLLIVLILVILGFFGAYFLLSDNISEVNNNVSGVDNEVDNKKTCEEQGGIWSIWSNIENPIKECNLPTSDGGKECTDSSQCESYCQAPEDSEIDSSVIGKCYEWKKTIVCMQEVRSGIADATWCY